MKTILNHVDSHQNPSEHSVRRCGCDDRIFGGKTDDYSECRNNSMSHHFCFQLAVLGIDAQARVKLHRLVKWSGCHILWLFDSIRERMQNLFVIACIEVPLTPRWQRFHDLSFFPIMFGGNRYFFWKGRNNSVILYEILRQTSCSDSEWGCLRNVNQFTTISAGKFDHGGCPNGDLLAKALN